MTDKERILTHIIQNFYPKYILNIDNQNHELYEKCKSDSIKVGDLVIAITSGLHEFSIGFVTQILDGWDMIIREIGSDKTCKIGNEQFYKVDIDKLNKNELLEGQQYKLYQKVKKSIYGTEYTINNKCYILCYVKFPESNLAEVHLREKWHPYDEINPIKFTFKYNNKITLKEIRNQMKIQLETK